MEDVDPRRLCGSEVWRSGQCHPLHASRRWCSWFWQLAVANAGCDNNWNWWWVGTRTQWNVTKDFYMGLDVALHENQQREPSDRAFLSVPLPGGYEHRGQARSPTRTTGSSASACIATSIPDRLIMESNNSPRRETAGGFCFSQISDAQCPSCG